VDTYCFRAPYVASLLRGGLAVSDADVHIGSGNVAWTLGGRPGCAHLRGLADLLLAPLSASC
jgi:hypothetical protein